MIAALGRLRRDLRGVTVIEFAIVAPVMLLLIMGLGELMYTVYAKAILDGAIQKAARDSAIQGGGDRANDIDALVMQQVRAMAPNATHTSSRLSYNNFTSIKPERFTDSNSNNRYDAGECFDDINGNGTWDADPGMANQGGASDVTKYRITVTYPRPFPVAGLMGWADTNTITSETLLKNQPWATQSRQVVVSRGNCS
jgi:Flp pilus assembly protein TadG